MEAAMVSVTGHIPGSLSKVASQTRDGFFSRFCAAIVESRRLNAESVINQYRRLLPRNVGGTAIERPGANVACPSGMADKPEQHNDALRLAPQCADKSRRQQDRRE